ncbi:MAG: type II toxin-antitoxin system VapC family toxin [Cyanobacteriota bacterium]
MGASGSAGLLLDTNILIDVLRGEERALHWLEGSGAGASISVITWMEIFVGCAAHESEPVEGWLRRFHRLDLDQALAVQAVQCRRRHGLKLPDAIILATARRHGLRLASRNSRNFPESLGDVLLPCTL